LGVFPIYARSLSGVEIPLAQGEIISGLVQLHVELSSLRESETLFSMRIHPYAIILSQGCDLEQDFLARKGQTAQDKVIPAVLFCEVNTAAELRNQVKKSEFWQRLMQNNDERYHFLQAVTKEADVGEEELPELAIDFKRFFTIPTDEVYYRIESGEALRRFHLKSPYLEHFCRRFANYLSRIALPEPHSST
jgi:hypothetical protein